MSAEITSPAPLQLSEPATMSASVAAMQSVVRKQRIQDWFFHKITMVFALTVLFVLVGIIISLINGAFLP